MTYDAVRAMAKPEKPDGSGPLIYYGKTTTLANHTNRSRDTEEIMLGRLAAIGLLIPQDRTRWPNGRWGSNRYVVLEHDEFAKVDPCPPFTYETSLA